MFKFLLILFLFGLFGFLFFVVVLGRVIRFFGSSSSNKTKSQSQSNKKRNQNSSADMPQKKFSKHEGEYVSYEEIKDEE